MKNDKGEHMKDLDFDELHEAVNKLMVQAQKPKAKREPSKSVAKAVTRPSVKVAERSADEDAAPVNITVRTKPVAKVLPKRRGMAMDVVQSAKPSTVAPPSARAARTAATLQPTGPVAAEPPKPRETTVVAPAEAPEPEEQHDISEDMLASINMQTDGDAKPKTLLDDDKPAESAFPDPIDVHGFADDTPKKEVVPEPETPKPTPTTLEHTATSVSPDPLLDDTADEPAKNQWDMPAEEKPKDEPAPAMTPEPEVPEPAAAPAEPPVEPPSTPFLNTKVEKRPLGSFVGAAPTPPVGAKHDESKPPITPSEEKQEQATIDVPAAPAELRPEIVAVESADVDYSQPEDEPKKDEPLGNLRQMSIPQQYHAHDKESNKDERPVFDTKDYHPPLQPVATAKHHTGSKAGALLTLILIIVLVAAGVGAYFVATGSIDLNNLF